jgi:molecular chaperone GrpE (heat shock protein)
LHEKRVRLTEDVKKSEKVWENAKKQSEVHKSAAIQSFASSLVTLGDHFNQIKKHQNDQHSVDLREGFENTSRLFFNTLEKFKIKQINTVVGDKVNRDQVEVVEEVKGAG